jgi:endonuclease/exonuclease/phosphatase (EEP) superfamily protein YafD
MSLLRFGVGLACAGLAAALLAGFLGRWLAPADSLAHFRHLLGPMAVVCAAAALWLRMRRSAAATGIVVLAAAVASWPHLPFAGPGPGQGSGGRGEFRLVQFNTLYRNQDAAEATRRILALQPDFVTLQEVSRSTRAIHDGLALELPHGVICRFGAVGDVAIRSRYPISASHCEEGNGLVWARVELGERALTVASLHAHWPWPYGQTWQIEGLAPEMRAMPRPAVLAGDFNAAPWSAAVRRIEREVDGKAVGGFRITLPLVLRGLEVRPMLPLDHVLLPDGAKATSAVVGPRAGSDHLPVVVDFDLAGRDRSGISR